MKSKLKKPDFVLITGAPRSGTYLLLTKLAREYDIAFPVETHFIPIFYRYRFLWGDLRKVKNREKMLEAIYKFLEIWTPRSERGRDYSAIKAESLLATRESASQIVEHSQNYNELVRAMYASFGRKKGKGALGDKSAFFSHVPTKLQASAVGPLKVIHIIRDGRDVSLSWMRIFTGPKTLTKAAIEWKKHVQQNHRWGEENQGSYMSLKYEELIAYPDTVLEQIATFLNIQKTGITQSSAGLEQLLATGAMHEKLASPPIPNNKNFWLSQMTSSELRRFEYFAGDALIQMGYEVTAGSYTFAQSSGYKISAALCRVYELFTIRSLRRIVKFHLPLLIWASTNLGVELASIADKLDPVERPA